MTDKNYHLERERQCRDMAKRAAKTAVKARHLELAELHHRRGTSQTGGDAPAA